MYQTLLYFKKIYFIFPVFSNGLLKYLAHKITMNKHFKNVRRWTHGGGKEQENSGACFSIDCMENIKE